MTRGRKPKPTETKRAAGNPGRRPLNKAEPTPPPALPAPPAHLDEPASEKWRELSAQLFTQGVLTTIDVDALAFYCVLFSRWQKAERIVREQGEIVTTALGNLVQNPYLSIANKSMEKMMGISVEFGMTPSSRSRVSVANPKIFTKLSKYRNGKTT
jgi:P27 family predicted phage terminase small subunit